MNCTKAEIIAKELDLNINNKEDAVIIRQAVKYLTGKPATITKKDTTTSEEPQGTISKSSGKHGDWETNLNAVEKWFKEYIDEDAGLRHRREESVNSIIRSQAGISTQEVQRLRVVFKKIKEYRRKYKWQPGKLISNKYYNRYIQEVMDFQEKMDTVAKYDKEYGKSVPKERIMGSTDDEILIDAKFDALMDKEYSGRDAQIENLNSDFLAILEEYAEDDSEGGVGYYGTTKDTEQHADFYKRHIPKVASMISDVMQQLPAEKISVEMWETTLKNRETAGSVDLDKRKITVRWNMESKLASKAEVLLHEVTHIMTHKVFNRKEYKVLRDLMVDLQESARKQLDYTIFLTDVVGKPTSHQIRAAKEKFSYVFEGDVEEFFVYANTNQSVYTALKNVTIKNELFGKIEAATGEKLTKFQEILNKFIDIINTVYNVMTHENKAGHQLAADTMVAMVEAQAQMAVSDALKEEADLSTIERLQAYEDKLNDRLKPQIDRLYAIVDDIKGTINKGAKASSVEKFVKLLKRINAVQKIIASRIAQDIFRDITQRTDNKQWAHIYEKFRKGKKFTEGLTLKIKTAVMGEVEKLYDEIENTTKEALTNVIFKTDLSALMAAKDEMGAKGLELEEVLAVIDEDASQLDSVIEATKKEIEEQAKNNVYFDKEMYAHMDALGKHMIDGVNHIHNQQTNVENILYKYYTTNPVKKVGPDALTNAELLRQMNIYTTLKAIQATGKEDRVLVAEFLKDSDNVEALKANMKMYKSYVDDAYHDIRGTIVYNPVPKGFLESPTKGNKKFELAPAHQLKQYKIANFTVIDDDPYVNINGVDYFRVVGNSYEAGFTEGAFSIIGQGQAGISVKKLMIDDALERVMQAKKEAYDKEPITSDIKGDIIESVEKEIEEFAETGKFTTIALTNNNIAPVYNESTGEIIDYKIQMSNYEQKLHLKLDDNISNVMAHTFSKMHKRRSAKKHNEEVVEMLINYETNYYDKDPSSFTKIEPQTKEEIESGKPETEANRLWKLIPPATRDYINFRREGNVIFIPNDFVDLIIGHKDVSIADWDFLKSKPLVRAWATAAEGMAREVLAYVKKVTVLLDGSVVMGNTVSNAMVAGAHGVDPVTYVKKATQKWKELNAYNEMAQRIAKVEVQVKMGKEGADITLKNLKKKIKTMPFHELVEDGQFSPFVEDINVEQDAGGHIAQAIDNAMNHERVPEGLRTIKNILYINKESAIFKTALKITQYGDIISREILREHQLEKFTKKHNRQMDKGELQDLYNYLDQLFVNYSYLSNKYIDYFDKVLGVFFLKYITRVGKSLVSMISKSPTASLALGIGQEMTGVDFSDPTDSFHLDILGMLDNREQWDNAASIIFNQNLTGLFPSLSDIVRFQ